MEQSGKDNFKRQVCLVVKVIPAGRVMTYGQIAALCGRPRAARIVGGIAHWSREALPWHRVVHKDGRLATGYPGGVVSQKAHLEAEGVQIGPGYKIDIAKLLWQPKRT